MTRVGVRIYLWTYVCSPIDYEKLPYLLNKRKCTNISELYRISITYGWWYLVHVYTESVNTVMQD